MTSAAHSGSLRLWASPGKWTTHCPGQHLLLEAPFGLFPPPQPEPEGAAGNGLRQGLPLFT
ncbi:unnamed protein product [Prunus armeniaca]